MLLADTIQQSKLLSKVPGWQAIGKDIAAAEKFVILRDVSVAADAVEAEEWKRIREFCRPPFPLTWLETLHADRPHFVNSLEPLQELEEVPVRIGILVRALNDANSAYIMSLFWSSRGTNAWAVSALSYLADYSAGAVFLQAAFDKRRVIYEAGVHAAATEIGHLAIPCPYVEEGMERFSRQQGTESILRFMVDRAIQDWQGEGTFWMSIMGLMAAKNAVQSEAVDRSVINKSRRRLGRPPLSDHHLCSLLTGRHGVRASGDATFGDAAIRAHFVRGHFKVRKTGIFWWSPFVRGDLAQGFAAKDYRVGAQ